LLLLVLGFLTHRSFLTFSFSDRVVLLRVEVRP